MHVRLPEGHAAAGALAMADLQVLGDARAAEEMEALGDHHLLASVVAHLCSVAVLPSPQKNEFRQLSHATAQMNHTLAHQAAFTSTFNRGLPY